MLPVFLRGSFSHPKPLCGLFQRKGGGTLSVPSTTLSEVRKMRVLFNREDQQWTLIPTQPCEVESLRKIREILLARGQIISRGHEFTDLERNNCEVKLTAGEHSFCFRGDSQLDKIQVNEIACLLLVTHGLRYLGPAPGNGNGDGIVVTGTFCSRCHGNLTEFTWCRVGLCPNCWSKDLKA